jgi:hypothetical protein
MLDTTLRDIIGFSTISVAVTATAYRLEAPERRRTWRAYLFAAVAAAVLVTVVDEFGLIRALHDDVVNRVGGEFDEAATWFVALAGALAAATVGELGLRAARRCRRPRDAQREGSAAGEAAPELGSATESDDRTRPLA